MTLFITCLAAEGILRLIDRPETIKASRPKGWAIIPEESWIEYHPDLGWFPQKNKQGLLKKNNRELPLNTNSAGFRGTREYSESKPTSITRIAALGDSFTFGFGVLDHETFPAQMERLDPHLEVMNLGVPGFGLDQIYLSLEKIAYAYQPDTVIVSIYPEDLWRSTRAFNDAGFGKPYFVLNPDHTLKLNHIPVPRNKDFSVVQFPDLIQMTAFDRMLAHSHLVRLIKKSWILMQKKLGLEDPDTTHEWLLGRAILDAMLESLRTHHIKPMIVIVPPARWLTGTVEPIRSSLVRYGKRNHVSVLDMTPIFQEALKTQPLSHWYIPDDDHWTAYGHRLVAENLIKLLASEEQLS